MVESGCFIEYCGVPYIDFGVAMIIYVTLSTIFILGLVAAIVWRN